MYYSHSELREILDFCLAKADITYVPDLSFEWSNRMTRCAGTAQWNKHIRCGVIKLSIPLFARTTPENRRHIVIHEICHIIEGLNGRKLSHDWYWRMMMLRCGETPKRCHSIDRTGIRRQTVRYNAYCNCEKPHQITKIRLTKMKKGLQYKCIKCNTILNLTKREPAQVC